MPAMPRRPYPCSSTSDRNDAVGLARIMQCGWYKEVQVKSHACHAFPAILNSRAQLVKTKRDLENQIRGLLKNHGLVIGKVGGNIFRRRAEELVGDYRLLQEAVRTLLAVREVVRREIADLTRKLLALALNSDESRRLMTAPGIGPINALAFCAAIDEPSRFRRSRSVGAYFGLTPRRYASGEVDWTGRISKRGDAMLRTLSLRSRRRATYPRTTMVQAQGLGSQAVENASASRRPRSPWHGSWRVILHRMWRDGTDFIWSTKEAVA
jgi:transposase